jgi:hypothetical protein
MLSTVKPVAGTMSGRPGSESSSLTKWMPRFGESWTFLISASECRESRVTYRFDVWP